MEDLTEKFTHLYNVIASKSFQNKESLGGEIPFFISAYHAVQELEVKDSIVLLKNKLASNGVKVLELNLYDIVCEILEDKGGVERMFQFEKTKSKTLPVAKETLVKVLATKDVDVCDSI